MQQAAQGSDTTGDVLELMAEAASLDDIMREYFADSDDRQHVETPAERP